MKRTRYFFALLSIFLFIYIGCGQPQTGQQEGIKEKTTLADGGTSTKEFIGETIQDAAPIDTTTMEKKAEAIAEAPSEAIPEALPEAAPQPNTGVCGMKAYQWLPRSQTGQLVAQEHLKAYSQDKQVLTYLLSKTKYKNLLTIKYGVEIYRYRYVTQDRGKKVEATGLVGFPKTTQPLKAPTVLWLHGTSGFMDDCAPSRGKEGPLSVAILASQGYVGVAPDYLGMNGMGAKSTMHHPYLVSEATALASLDALRAAKKLIQSINAPVTPLNKLVVWGGSQGGHATLVSILYAPYYAPEYEIVAAIALIPPVDLVKQIEKAVTIYDESPNTTFSALSAFTAMSRWYGYFSRLKEVVTDKDPYHLATETAKQMDSTCKFNISKDKLKKITDVFQKKFVDSLTSSTPWKGYDIWKCMAKENSLIDTSVQRRNDPPILFVVSEKDRIVIPSVQRQSFKKLCAKGYKMNYIECKGNSHTKGAVNSLPQQIKWLDARLKGEPMKDVCVLHKPTCCSGDQSCQP